MISWKISLYSYLGFLLPTVTLQSLGAAAAVASTYVTQWGDGYQGGNVGGLLAAMLGPTGRFGKFLTFLLSLSVAGNIAATFYSVCLNLQVFMPFLVVVPRYVFSIVATAMSVLSVSSSSRDADMNFQRRSCFHRGCSQILRHTRKFSGNYRILGWRVHWHRHDGTSHLQAE